MPKVSFNRPALIGNEVFYLREAISKGQLSGDGHFTGLCQTKIEQITGGHKALLTHSCTAALEMAAILCDLEAGDEVIMPSFTFVSTANAVVLRGAVPVFVDIDPVTLNIDPEAAQAAMTSRTKAIFAVHYAGFPADMVRLREIADSHDCLLVEDAAQALGSYLHGKPCGGLGDLAAFSFHETKNIISGEGGALVINREDLIERAEIIREKGTNRSVFQKGMVDKYTWVDIGSSFLPGELVASFLYAQLEQFEEINNRRLSLFDRYMAAFRPLQDAGRLIVPQKSNASEGNGHMFYLLLKDMQDRDAFIAYMREEEITAPFHYVPLHSAPAGKQYGRADGPAFRNRRYFGPAGQAADVFRSGNGYRGRDRKVARFSVTSGRRLMTTETGPPVPAVHCCRAHGKWAGAGCVPEPGLARHAARAGQLSGVLSRLCLCLSAEPVVGVSVLAPAPRGPDPLFRGDGLCRGAADLPCLPSLPRGRAYTHYLPAHGAGHRGTHQFHRSANLGVSRERDGPDRAIRVAIRLRTGIRWRPPGGQETAKAVRLFVESAGPL